MMLKTTSTNLLTTSIRLTHPQQYTTLYASRNAQSKVKLLNAKELTILKRLVQIERFAHLQFSIHLPNLFQHTAYQLVNN